MFQVGASQSLYEVQFLSHVNKVNNFFVLIFKIVFFITF